MAGLSTRAKRPFDVAGAIGGLIVFAVNVLRGELSAVGPRPLMEADVRRLGWTVPACDVRWSVPPGLTGLAQVVGTRSARHALRLDRCYIARQNLRLDARLIAWSFAINVLGKTCVRRLISG